MRKQKGFTLIELLVVIAIIGILATIVMVSLNTARQKARDSRRISDARQVQLAEQMYYDNNTSYSATLAQLTSSGLISSDPTDPGTTPYVYNPAPDACTGLPAAACSSYVFQATLEASNTAFNNDVDGTVDGTDCADANMHYCVTQ